MIVRNPSRNPNHSTTYHVLAPNLYPSSVNPFKGMMESASSMPAIETNTLSTQLLIKRVQNNFIQRADHIKRNE